jgi:hypothetical protein
LFVGELAHYLLQRPKEARRIIYWASLLSLNRNAIFGAPDFESKLLEVLWQWMAVKDRYSLRPDSGRFPAEMFIGGSYNPCDAPMLYAFDKKNTLPF